METQIKQLPGYQVNEYKLVLVPHEDLSLKIMEVRDRFNKKIKTEQPITSLPEVLLAGFKILKQNELRLINRLKIISMGLPLIKVEVKNYGSFPSHTIFLNVTSKLPIGNLVKKIRTDAQMLMKLDNDNKPHFPTDSYITIARKLLPWQYEKAWLELKDKNFTGRFIASRMLLLKRKEGEFKYKPVENFQFENLPIETKQGELF